VSSWSNPFVSVIAASLLAGCADQPVRSDAPAPQAPAVSAAPTRDAPAAAAGPAAASSAAAGVAKPQPDPVPERAASQYAQALQLAKAGHTIDAELEFQQLAAAYPQFAGPQVNLGLLYLRDSHLNEAEASFKKALAMSTENAVAGNELGIVERKLGKFADAEAAYQRAITADPNYAPAYLNLGVLYDLYLAEPQKALEQFERYIAIAGENKQVSGWVVELRKRVAVPAPAAKKEPA
jgi:tetratricopeptide (TPR) repeat protein